MKFCRIHEIVGSPPSEETVAAFRVFPTTVVSDQLDRDGAVHGVRRITRADLGILAGRVVSVRVPPGDNLGIYVAVEHAQPGDVLVVDAGGSLERAVMGELFYRHMVTRGLGGIVIDGVIRDSAEIAAGPMHVFARGASHLGPGKRGPGDVHAAVTLGGTVVRTNDIVVGDADGIAIIPNARIAATLVGAQALLEREVQLLERAASGNMDLTWLHEEVTQVGVPALTPGPVLGGPARAERR